MTTLMPCRGRMAARVHFHAICPSLYKNIKSRLWCGSLATLWFRTMTTNRTDAENAAFAREVEDDIRKEQLLRLVRRYGPWLAGVAAAALIGFAGYSWQQSRRVQQEQAWHLAFTKAIQKADAGNMTQARKDLQALAEDSGQESYGLLAAFAHASMAGRDGAAKAAAAEYASLAHSGAAVPPLFASLARTASASRTLDGQWPEGWQAALQNSVSQEDAWQHVSRELLALKAQSEGDMATARKHWQALLDDPALPQDLAPRARQMLASLPKPDAPRKSSDKPSQGPRPAPTP